MAETHGDVTRILLDGFPEEMLEVADEVVIAPQLSWARLFLLALPPEGDAIDCDLQEVRFRDGEFVGFIGRPALPGPLAWVFVSFLLPFCLLLSEFQETVLAGVQRYLPDALLV